MSKKVLALILTVLMAISMMSVTAMAEEQTTDVANIGENGYNTLAEAIAAVQDGETITLNDGTHVWNANWKVQNKTVTFTGSKNAVIDMTNVHTGQNTSGATLVFNGITITFGNANYKGFAHAAKVTYTDCTLIGTQFMYAPEVAFTNCEFKVEGDAYAVWTYGASDVTFTNCTFNTDGKAVLVYTEGNHTATINVNNCEFTATTNRSKAAVEVGQSANGAKGNYTLSIIDSNADENFVANHSTSNLWGNKNDMVFGDMVVEIDSEVVNAPVYIGDTGYATLADAIAAAKDGDTITLKDGTHTMPNSVANKNITIKGGKDAVVEMLTAVNATGSTIAFEGITAKFDNDNYEGLQHAVKVTYTDCTIEGTQFMYAPEVAFTNCEFKVEGDVYAVWTYGASDVTFTNCIFNTDGKAILVYIEGAHAATINVSGCTFNAATNRSKAAVEIGASWKDNEIDPTISKYTLNITNSTADSNFVANNTESNLWGNKNSITTESGSSVTIDGSENQLPAPVIAVIGETGYTSLAAAIDAVQDGETIVLQKATSTDTITVSRDITFTIKGTDYLKADIQPGRNTTVDTAENDAEKTITYTFDYTRPVISGGSSTYSVTVNTAVNGTVTAAPKNASKNSTITVTVTPDDGYELDAVSVKDKNGKEIALTKVSDNKYTFVMPASRVTVTASFKEIEKETVSIAFIDVLAGEYYYDAVLWAVENGVTDGTSTTTFSPLMSCTRAQAVTFLWRAAGSPEPTGSVNPFADVDADEYYYKAVLWAVENGITDGTSADTFSPDATVTRAQVVTFLYRLAGEPAVSGSNAFGDVAADAYYADAVQSAVVNGITDGTSDSTFSPELNCNRAQIVTFLYRYFVK